MELYARVCRAVRVEGRSRRAVTLDFGVERKEVRKMLEYSMTPGYSVSSRFTGRSCDSGKASSTQFW